MLTGRQIGNLNLIERGKADRYRAASYDLTIGKIVNPDGSLSDTYTVPAQGIIQVVSEELVRVPPDYAGIAIVKTSLCNDGLLALNIGVLDPGWHGPVASFLINFGKKEKVLKKGDTFLRATFHRLEEVTDAKISSVNEKEYIAQHQVTFTQRFADTFLDIRGLIDRFSEENFKKWRGEALTIVSAAAFGLALITFFLNFGNLLLVQRWIQPGEATQAAVIRSAYDEKLKSYQADMKSLSETNLQLQERLRVTSMAYEEQSRTLLKQNYELQSRVNQLASDFQQSQDNLIKKIADVQANKVSSGKRKR